ncbi:MAG TPA: hypothetical protein DD979_05180 [Gammaproteobacteria bacterium]|jgi:hypothetical protein|nr:hypothetical protein [Gammaproteobacteria bacterium]
MHALEMLATVKSYLWSLTKILAVVLCVFAFSPTVLSPDKPTPAVWGLPVSLGLGIGVSLGLLVLVIVGALVAPSEAPKGDD